MKFEYVNPNNKTKQIEVDLTSLPQPDNINLILLDNDTLNAIPGYFHRTFQTCDWWVMKDGKIDVSLFHERYYTPYNWMKNPYVNYWLDGAFKTPEEMVKAIHAKGCDVSKFYAQQHFYSDEECYFPITKDFDEALKFCGYRYEGEKEALKELDKSETV